MEMLSLPTWREEPLTLHFFSSSHLELQSGGPPLPPHMRVDVAPMEVSSTDYSIVEHHFNVCLVLSSLRALSEGCRLFRQWSTMTLTLRIPMAAMKTMMVAAPATMAAAVLWTASQERQQNVKVSPAICA